MPRIAKEDRPERHGQAWTEDEENFVLKRVSQKADYSTIADEVQRSIGGVYSHLKELAYRYVVFENKLLEEASQLTGCSIQDIQDHITKKEMVKKMKEEKGLVKKCPQFPVKKEEDLMDILKEIRDLLKMLVLEK